MVAAEVSVIGLKSWHRWFGLTWYDVLVLDGDVAVSVGPALLVPPPQSMEDLVQHNPDGLAPSPNGDVLMSAPKTTYIGVTPADAQRISKL